MVFKNYMDYLRYTFETTNIHDDPVIHSSAHTRIVETLNVESIYGEIYQANDILALKMPNGKGFCGSPILEKNSEKIIGIHRAGSNGTSYVGVVTAECIEAALKEFLSADEILPEGRFYQEKGVKYEKIHMPNRTTLRKTPFHGQFGEVKTMPSSMTIVDRGSGSALMNALEKGNQTNTQVLDEHLLDEIVQYTYDNLPEIRAQDFSPIDVEAALNGVPGIYKSMDLSTSAGWPLIETDKSRKRDWVLGEENRLKMKPELEDMYKSCCSHEFEVRFVDYLKDEKLSKEKVALKKTRLFSSGPFAFLLYCRRYFLPILKYFEDYKIETGILIGINPHSTDWNKLVEWFGGEKALYLCGDHGSFDVLIPLLVGLKIQAFVKRLLPKKYHKDIDYIFSQILNSVHIVDGVSYIKIGGNPSGHPFTTWFNCIANLFMTIYCFAQLAKRNQADWKKMWKLVRAGFFGDDNMISKNPQLTWFNMVTLSAEFAKIGMKYTPPTKGEITVENYTLSECAFLQRNFRKTKFGYYVGELNMETIRETLHFYRRGSDVSKEESWAALIRAVLDELVLYGPEVYVLCREEIDEAIRDLQLPIQYSHSYIERVVDIGISPARCEVYAGDLITYLPKQIALEEISYSPSSVNIAAEFKVDQTEFVGTEIGSENQLQSITEEEEKLETTVNLTTFLDNVGVDDMFDEPNVQIDRDPDPFVKQDLTAVLTRAYPLTTVMWNTDQPIGTLLARIRLPDKLFDMGNVQDKTTYFKYLVTDFLLSFRLNASIFHFGALLVCFVPTVTSPSFSLNFTKASWFPHAVITVDHAETEMLHIKYYNNRNYWGVKEAKTKNTVNPTDVYVFVLNDLQVSELQGTTAIPLTIYGTMVNPQLAGLAQEEGDFCGYVSQNPFISELRELVHKHRKIVNALNVEKDEITILPYEEFEEEYVCHCQEVAREESLTHELIAFHEELRNLIQEESGTRKADDPLPKTPNSPLPPTPPKFGPKTPGQHNYEQMKKRLEAKKGSRPPRNSRVRTKANQKKKNTNAKKSTRPRMKKKLNVPKTADIPGSSNEQEEKSETGMLSSVAKGIASTAEKVSKVPVIGGIASVVAPIANTVGSIASFFGWEKPLDISTVNRQQLKTWENIMHSDGRDGCYRWSMRPGTQQSTDSTIFNTDDTDEMNVNSIAQTPTLLRSQRFTSTLDANTIIFSIPVHPAYMEAFNTTNYMPSYCAMIAKSCQYWRGSMKYFVLISASKTMVCRLRFSYIPGSAKPVSLGDRGDIVSKVVDITGTTSFGITIPFLYDRPYSKVPVELPLPNGDPSIPGHLVVSVENPLVVGTSTQSAGVWINLWSAAGEDMEFFLPQGFPDNFNFSNDPVVTPPGVDSDPPGSEGSEEIVVLPGLAEEEIEIREVFDSTFEPLAPSNYIVHPDINIGERFDHIQDLTLRYKHDGSTLVQNPGPQTINPRLNFSRSLLRMFRFWRAAYRHKYLYHSKDFGDWRVYAEYQVNNGSTITTVVDPIRDTTYLKIQPYFEWEFPRNNTLLFDINDNTNTSVPDGTRFPLDYVIKLTNQTESEERESLRVLRYSSYSDDSSWSFLQFPGFMVAK